MAIPTRNNRFKTKVNAVILFTILFFFGMIFADLVDARKGEHRHGRSSGHSSGRSFHKSGSTKKISSGSRSSRRSAVAKRDHHGRIARSPNARHSFVKNNPCPSTGKKSGRCPGYVVDHVVPLKRGGADRPSNMQWQTIQAAKQKDKWE